MLFDADPDDDLEPSGDTWTKIEIRLLLEKAESLREALSAFCAAGGLAGHRGHATPLQLARLDRMLLGLVALSTSLLNHPDWLEPVGRAEEDTTKYPRRRNLP